MSNFYLRQANQAAKKGLNRMDLMFAYIVGLLIAFLLWNTFLLAGKQWANDVLIDTPYAATATPQGE